MDISIIITFVSGLLFVGLLTLFSRWKVDPKSGLLEATIRIKRDPSSVRRVELLDNEPILLRITFSNSDSMDIFTRGVFAVEHFRELQKRSPNCEFVITRNGRRVDIEGQLHAIWC